MASPFELKVTGIEQLQNRIKKLSEAVKVEVVKEIQASGEVIRNAAVVRVPVDTGFLKNSISVKNLDNGVENVAQKDYSAYVEFGTGTKVDVPAGLEDYAIQFKGKGERQVNLPARPFMFPSYFEEKPRLIKRLQNLLDKQ